MKAMLVYQYGIANVFQVESFNLSNHGREAKRLLQHGFQSCEMYARGLGAAGVTVRTAACNEDGDIIHRPWSSDLEDPPFSDRFQPVFMERGEDLELVEGSAFYRERECQIRPDLEDGCEEALNRPAKEK